MDISLDLCLYKAYHKFIAFGYAYIFYTWHDFAPLEEAPKASAPFAPPPLVMPLFIWKDSHILGRHHNHNEKEVHPLKRKTKKTISLHYIGKLTLL